MRLLSSFAIAAVLALGCGSAASSSGTGGNGGAGTTSSSANSSTATTTSATTTASNSATSTTSSTGTTSSSSSTGTGGGMMGSSGDCTSGSDCSSGQCVEVTPGGFHVCLDPPMKATTCNDPGLDQCCATMPCPNNEPCYLGPLVPFCAGIPMQPHNQCAVDQCSKDADCNANQICALAGTLGVEIRACVYAGCKTNADCTAHPGGSCAPVKEPCCNATAGLFCVYPSSDGCRSNADCPSSPNQPRYCAPDPNTGVSACQNGGPVCPA